MCFNDNFVRSRRSNYVTLLAGLSLCFIGIITYQTKDYTDLFLYFVIGVLGLTLVGYSIFTLLYLIKRQYLVNKLRKSGEVLSCTVIRAVHYKSAYRFVCVYKDPVSHENIEFTSDAYTCSSAVADATINSGVLVYVQKDNYNNYVCEMSEVIGNILNT